MEATCCVVVIQLVHQVRHVIGCVQKHSAAPQAANSTSYDAVAVCVKPMLFWNYSQALLHS
jgi:hypothetical protein